MIVKTYLEPRCKVIEVKPQKMLCQSNFSVSGYGNGGDLNYDEE